MSQQETLTPELIKVKALEFGATLAGVVSIDELKKSPSHEVFGKLEAYAGVGTKETGMGVMREVKWPEGAKSLIIIAVGHPEDEPRLDWWQDGLSGGTSGNRILMDVINALATWLDERGAGTEKIAYHIEHGGVFLKDAAVLGGLGCIGRNNILLTEEYGPRVRLRALALDIELPSTGAIEYDPCSECPQYCRKACPQKAFAEVIYDAEELGIDKLPGREGGYSRTVCNIQMDLDIKGHTPIVVEGQKEAGKLVNYCRKCELSCPAGR